MKFSSTGPTVSLFTFSPSSTSNIPSSSAEIQLLKSTYQAIYRKDMARVVADELSLKTKDLFMMALAGNRGTQASDGGYGDGFLDQKKVDIDVEHLYKAGEGRFGTDEIGM